MNAGSGPPSQTPFAIYDPATCTWKMSQLSLLGDSMESSPAWPKSGTWDLGAAYAHPTSAHPTAANGSSSSPGLLPTPRAGETSDQTSRPGYFYSLSSAAESLLPTPSAGNFNDGETLQSWETRRQANLAKGINGNGQGTPLAIAARALLPSSAARDCKGAGTPREGGPDLPLTISLLKTPTAQLAINGGSQAPAKRRSGGHGPTLADQVEHELLPTPTVANSRNSRNSTAGRSPGSAAHPGTTLSDTFWAGANTAPPSTDGKPFSDGPRHHQLRLDETGSA